MNDAALSLVPELEKKLNILIERHREILLKNDRFGHEIEQLKKINEDQKKEISEIKSQYNILKLSKTIESKEGAAEAKTKINELVREIDRCIGLLNT